MDRLCVGGCAGVCVGGCVGVHSYMCLLKVRVTKLHQARTYLEHKIDKCLASQGKGRVIPSDTCMEDLRDLLGSSCILHIIVFLYFRVSLETIQCGR